MGRLVGRKEHDGSAEGEIKTVSCIFEGDNDDEIKQAERYRTKEVQSLPKLMTYLLMMIGFQHQ